MADTDGKRWISERRLQRFWNGIKSRFTSMHEEVEGVKTFVHEEMVDYVTDWLDDHVTPTEAPVVIDDSLSISGAAADAKVAGDEIRDLKSAINDITDTNPITFTQDYYIKTNVAIGSVVDLTPVYNNAFEYSIKSVSPFEHVHINGWGWTNGRLWAFIDSDNKLISVSSANLNATNGIIVKAPENASKIIINSYKGDTGACYIGESSAEIKGQIEKVESRWLDVAKQNKQFTEFNRGYIKTNEAVGTVIDFNVISDVNTHSCVIKCSEGDTFMLTGTGGGSCRLWAFVDDDRKLISNALANQTVANLELTAYNDGYLVVNINVNYTYSLSGNVLSSNVQDGALHQVDTILKDWNIKKAIATNYVIGTTIDLTPYDTGSVACMVVPCNAGDSFLLTGNGGNTPLLWAFVDNENVIKRKSEMGSSVNRYKLEAYESGKLIVNIFTAYDYELCKIEDSTSSAEIDMMNESLYENRYVETIFPSKVCVCGGREMSIYYKAILRYMNADKINMIRSSSIELYNYKMFCRITPSDNDNREFDNKIGFYISNNNLADFATKSHKFKVIPKTAGNGLTKKVLIIGDSLTDADVYLSEVNNLLTNDVMHIEFLGTRDTDEVPNEGYSGWRAYTFAKCETASDDGISTANTNPFYNPSTQEFDFAYYMTAQGYSGVDYVFINLGVNDIGRNNHYSDFTDFYDLIIASIHDYDANIRIGIGLPPVRGLMDNGNQKSVNDGLYADKKLISVYDNRENENIYVIPFFLNVDPDHDYNFVMESISVRNPDVKMMVCTDSTHPSSVGYYKMADVLYSYLKYFGYLDQQ